ncbi:MAG TPA: lysyl oxidase family protein [Sporichthyaceae bacterium]|nr:lysyl oxidase family protein [Sporichthyaceae bacterium]
MSVDLCRGGLVLVALGAALLAGPIPPAGPTHPVTHAVMTAAMVRAPADTDPDGLHLPDLAMAPTADLRVITSRDGHEQLRFTSTMVNLGQGPLVVAARRSAPGAPWEVVQQILAPDGYPEREIPLRLQPVWGGDGHNHWHVPDVARYRLLRLDDGEEVGANHKIGFCFFDNAFYRDLPQTPRGPGFPDDTGCAHGDRRATSFRMGLSVGFADVYRWRIPGQSIDITGLPPGRYRLEGKANGDDALHESDTTDHLDWVDFQLIRHSRAAKLQIIGRGATPEPAESDHGAVEFYGTPSRPATAPDECLADDPAAESCNRRG